MSIDPEPLFGIVQKANMPKLWPDGLSHYDEDGNQWGGLILIQK